jgi:hypothetical protein
MLLVLKLTPFVSDEEYAADKSSRNLAKKMTADRYLSIWKEGGGEKLEFWQS